MKKLILSFSLLIIVISVNAQANRTEVLQGLEKNQVADQNKALTARLKSSSRLFGDKNDLTSVIMVIPSGSTVSVLGSDSAFLYVAFEENEGYIFARHAVIDKTPVTIQPVIRQEEQPVQEEMPVQQQQQQQQISRFTYLENKYGSSMAARLYSGKIWRGMTSEMVKDSWGSPLKINRVISDNIIKEEWIYKNTWLYLQNNALAEWGPVGR
jgi:hypothetical protein